MIGMGFSCQDFALDRHRLSPKTGIGLARFFSALTLQILSMRSPGIP